MPQDVSRDTSLGLPTGRCGAHGVREDDGGTAVSGRACLFHKFFQQLLGADLLHDENRWLRHFGAAREKV